MYRNCNNVLVTGGSSTYVARGSVVNIHGSRSGTPYPSLQGLQNHVAASALYNSGEVSDQPKCHPGTRVAILEHLEAWARALTYFFPIIWLHGPAGSGKSSILRTIAHILFEQKLLLASFFFFRSATDRNSSNRFIATIALQLALFVPPTRSYIDAAIQENPIIFSLSIWDQAQALIVFPLLAWCRDNPTDEFGQKFPRVIIIDGLDECQGSNKQCEILQTLCRILKSVPIPLAVLIASRPEHHIRSAFDLNDLNRLSSRLALDDSYNPDADIRKYLKEKFSMLARHHRTYLVSSPWPSPKVIDKLVAKASGQFVYASTIMKFVGSLRHNPVKRLDIILGIINAGKLKPFEELDLLYSVIFFNIDEDDRPEVLRILGVLLIPYREEAADYRTPAFLEHLLHLDTGDIRRLLFDLESLLTLGRDCDPVRFSHASLGDYLFDRSRSEQFWIDGGKVYADLAQHCTIRLYDSERRLGFKNFFNRNAPFFFSNATPTLKLREAIEHGDLAKVMGDSIWVSAAGTFPDLTFTLIQAICCSSFLDVRQLYIDKVAACIQTIQQRNIKIHFHDLAVKHFLITAAASADVIFCDNLQESYFGCLLQMFPAATKFCFMFCDLTIMQIFKSFFNDASLSNLGYFVDDKQYADVALYLVRFMMQPCEIVSSSLSRHRAGQMTLEKCMSIVFPVVLLKSSMHQGLLNQIKKALPHQIHWSYLEFDLIKDALAMYILRSETDLKSDVSCCSDNQGSKSRSSPIVIPNKAKSNSINIPSSTCLSPAYELGPNHADPSVLDNTRFIKSKRQRVLVEYDSSDSDQEIGLGGPIKRPQVWNP